MHLGERHFIFVCALGFIQARMESAEPGFAEFRVTMRKYKFAPTQHHSAEGAARQNHVTSADVDTGSASRIED